MGVALGARSAYADAGGPVEIAAECRVGPDQPKASHLKTALVLVLSPPLISSPKAGDGNG
jgi:hypothetical protein